jgi:hypothetical protein
MHLCVQDNPIGRKFKGLALADMARLPHLIIQKILVPYLLVGVFAKPFSKLCHFLHSELYQLLI